MQNKGGIPDGEEDGDRVVRKEREHGSKTEKDVVENDVVDARDAGHIACHRDNGEADKGVLRGR